MLNGKRQAVFISGQGSNLKALADLYPNTDFLVYANKNCRGLTWARRRGLSVSVVDLKSDDDWICFANLLNDLKVSRIFLLGFMKIIPQIFLEKTKAKVLNIHPSVLPDFPGLKSIERSFLEKRSMGCSLHEVVTQVDTGTLVLQKKVESNFVSSLDSLEEQVHGFEQLVIGKHVEMTRGLYG